MAAHLVRHFRSIAVDSLPVAPHRYLWDDANAGSNPYANTHKEWLASVPYKPGEVIWFMHNDTPKRGLVYSIKIERDRYDDKREVYMVQPETKEGIFSQRYVKTYPGYVQRGYHAAGLAPEYKG